MPSRRIASVIAIVGVLAAAAPAAGAATSLPLPTSMAAVGDSITQAASSAGSLGVDAPQNSWSTGTNTTVASHAQRLQALGATMSVANRSVSGAKMADLQGQMTTVVALQPDYLTVLIGGNDLCTDTVAQMTAVADFQAQFQAAMATLATGSPDTNVLVASVPDAYRLWDLFKSNTWARIVWSAGDICQSLLANPGSTQAADVQRRAAVRQRNIDYNAVLASVCASYARCRFDGNAVFDTAFARSDVSGDYFHPSVAGQAKIAAATWAAGYAWFVEPPVLEPVWVGGLTASTTVVRSNWTATVTIAVASADGPAAGATVTGSWTGASGATTCVTAADGRCSLASGTLGKKSTSVTLRVVGVAGPSLAYDAGANVQSSITVAKP